jgi:hypothetical protein
VEKIEITEQLVLGELKDAGWKLIEGACLGTRHILKAFQKRFGREPDGREARRIAEICADDQKKGLACERCIRAGVWCLCAC